MEFSTLSEAQEAFNTLSSEHEAANGLLTEAQEQVTALQGQLEAANTAANEASEKVTSLESQITERDEKIGSLEADVIAKTAEVEKLKSESLSVEQAAARIAANLGIAPLENSPGNTGKEELSRAQFDALKPAEKHAFFKRGGKIAA